MYMHNIKKTIVGDERDSIETDVIKDRSESSHISISWARWKTRRYLVETISFNVGF